MKRIYLLRHAKSSWSEDGQADYERGLAPRGLHAARQMSAHLRDRAVKPSVVLCSTARRARETLDLIMPGLTGKPGIRYEDSLYQAAASDIIARIKQLPEKTASVMIVGHNPGLQETVLELAGAGAPKRMRQIAEKFPTLALAELSTDIEHWRDLGPGAARLVDLTIPAEIED